MTRLPRRPLRHFRAGRISQLTAWKTYQREVFLHLQADLVKELFRENELLRVQIAGLADRNELLNSERRLLAATLATYQGSGLVLGRGK